MRHYWGHPADVDWYFSSASLSIDNVSDGEWHSAAAQFDGSARRILFDGVVVVEDSPLSLYAADFPSGVEHANVNDNFCLGAQAANLHTPFTGSIRNMQVFSSGTCDFSPPSQPPSPPPLPPTAPPGGAYCADATCGAALLSDGWKVLSEWGTVDRFGEGLIGSHADFVANEWFVPNDGSVAADYFNNHHLQYRSNYATDPQVTQWYANHIMRAAYEHFIPVGTTQVVVAFAGSSESGSSSFSCTAAIYDHSGKQVYSRTRQNDGFSPFPDPDVVAVNTTAGPARIRFQEDLVNICWTAYVLYYGPDFPRFATTRRVTNTTGLAAAVSDPSVETIVVAAGTYHLTNSTPAMCANAFSHVTGLADVLQNIVVGDESGSTATHVNQDDSGFSDRFVSALCIHRHLTIRAETNGTVVLDATHQTWRALYVGNGARAELVGLRITGGRLTRVVVCSSRVAAKLL